MNLCVSDSEECEDGVGTGVNDTMLSETLSVITLAESASTSARVFRLREKPLCACDTETPLKKKPEETNDIAGCCKRVLLRLRLDFEFSDFWVSFLVIAVPAAQSY